MLTNRRVIELTVYYNVDSAIGSNQVFLLKFQQVQRSAITKIKNKQQKLILQLNKIVFRIHLCFFTDIET
jgi:hypothetical protein